MDEILRNEITVMVNFIYKAFTYKHTKQVSFCGLRKRAEETGLMPYARIITKS
jgi:hypothetical protein